MSKLYEYCYVLREIMIHDNKPITWLDKIKFSIVSYFANKY